MDRYDVMVARMLQEMIFDNVFLYVARISTFEMENL